MNPFLTCHIPVDEHTNNGPEDPLVSPTPESTSGGGPSTADPLDQVTTQANGEAPTESAGM